MDDILGRKDFELKVENSKGIVIVEFYKNDCPPCELIKSTLENWEKDNKDIKFYGCEFKYRGNWNTAMKYKITGYPTILTFFNGIEVNRNIGTQLRKRDILRK